MLRLAGSALVVLIAPPLYLMLDLAVVGRLGATELAALTVATLVLSVISTQLTFLSYGTTARSARAFGAGDRRRAVDEGVQASWIAVGVGAAIVVVAWLLAPAVTGALVPDHQVAAEAASWLRIAVFGVPLILLAMAGNGWMRGVQDTRRPVYFVVAGLAVAAVLCVGLVHGVGGLPRLGLQGSAWANLVGQSLTGIAFAVRLIGESRGRLRPDWPVIRAQLTMARDLVLRSLSFQVCFISAAAVAARFGVAQVAAHQVVLQLWEFSSLLLDSLAIAAQQLVGAALGAGAFRVARRAATRATAVSVGISVLLAAVLAAGVAVIPRIFTDDAAILDAMRTPWWFFVAMLPIAGAVFALDGVLLGSGDAAFLRTATLAGALGAFLPLIWLSWAFDWGLAGIWSGLLAFMCTRLAAVVWRVRSGAWVK
ncbi:MATE family efflux transporter [Gordonia sp. PS3]|uniref:MatE family protein n=1 Tax=Gordonia sihwensis NBRC 108236 TaxID=1223544 RepID=L7LJA8_9ACTN|nr:MULTISPECIES: MATE family efflux transporter [Gordonia]AUH69260.1 MATE family efflux transporter [Gordonia sp. YC-JH1]GAC60821.1 MatE family protein [Gordonia sihwensis NBRC 108236]